MTGERFLLDTVFVQALLNKRDPHHDEALAFLPHVEAASEVWITEAVLIEVGNALSGMNRQAVVEFIDRCYKTPNMRVVTVDRPLLEAAVRLYQQRPDKDWGLTDCISFVVMARENLTDAATADRHFTQAGYRALLWPNAG